MIRINLLREPAQQRTVALTGQSKMWMGMLAVAALVVAGFVYWYWSLTGTVQQQLVTIQELQTEAGRLDNLNAQLQQFQQQKNDLQRRLQVVERLQNSRQGPVRLMNSIINSIPTDPNLWLTSLTQRSDTLTMEGRAFDVPPIAEFIARLTNRPPIREVELDFWEQDGGTVRFKVTCKLEQ